ncbi:MAG: hypothetical protein QM754_11025 [Tepidisphaeraceae bacterium]
MAIKPDQAPETDAKKKAEPPLFQPLSFGQTLIGESLAALLPLAIAALVLMLVLKSGCR